MEGSKNPETCVLYAGEFKQLGVGSSVEWVRVYPVSISFPPLIPHEGSLSLGEPNLTY